MDEIEQEAGDEEIDFATASRDRQDAANGTATEANDIAFELRQQGIATERAKVLKQNYGTTEDRLEEEADRLLEEAGFTDLIEKRPRSTKKRKETSNI